MEEENKSFSEDVNQASSDPVMEENSVQEQATTSSKEISAQQSGISEQTTDNPIPKNDSSNLESGKTPNAFIKFLKSIPGIITIAAIIAGIVLAIVFISKHGKEKEYEENLKEFIVESSKSSMASAYICEDLRKIWHDYIFEDKEYFDRSTGTFSKRWGSGYTYCSNFSEAVNKKIAWNKENLPSTLTEPYYNAKRLYKAMTPPPGKYKDIHVYVKQMFKAMERLHELSTNPTGNLSTYSTNCNQAVEDYTSALSDLTNECDIDFSKVGDKDDLDY